MRVQERQDGEEPGNARRQRLEAFHKDMELHGSCLQRKDRVLSANRDCVTRTKGQETRKRRQVNLAPFFFACFLLDSAAILY